MQVIKIPITQIVCNEWNPNVMSAKQRQALNESLEEFGDILPLVVRKVDDNYQIVDGQHRFESLQSLPEVDCVVIDVSDTQAMRLTQILNRTRGEDDPERLADLLETLSSQISIEELIHGMPIDSEAEFNELLSSLQAGLPQDEDEDFGGGLTGDDEMPDEVETRVKRGDIWELGRHRIMCGDSTVAEDVAALMDGKKADMVFTDPPYGMNLDTQMSKNVIYKGNWKNKPKDYGKVIGDNDDFSPDLINTIFENFAYVKEIFIWGADYFAEILPSKNNGSWITWDKRFGLESVEYSTSEFELCWSKSKHQRKIARFAWFGIIGTEQEFDHKRHHPTQKPINLAIWFFDNWGKDCNLVVDLFLGSGSTLIAAEKTDRICYGMELSEHYCDVIIKRWEDYTGDVAIKL